MSVATTMAPFGNANPIIDAVRSGDCDRLTIAIETNPGDVNRPDALGRTALHYAARLGMTDAVAQLLDTGAEVDPVDSDGYTPLMRAVAAGHSEAAALLVAAGADQNRH